MALSFLSPKAFRAEVTEGIDLEQGIILSGERITIGSAPGDTLRLGAGDIAGEHVTLIRAAGGSSWEYFTSDRGQTSVDKGNSRTGKVRPGMWFRLGNETKLEIRSVARPAEMDEAKGGEAKKEIPLAVALPIMGLMLVGFMAYMTSIAGGGQSNTGSLRTEKWFVGAEDIGPALDACLETGVEQARSSGQVTVVRSAPDAKFRTYVDAALNAPDTADGIRVELSGDIRKLLARAHLLAQEQQFLSASQTLRRLEYVLPVGLGKCPILSAARNDLAVFELRNGRR